MAVVGAAFFRQVPKQSLSIYYLKLEAWSIEAVEFALDKSVEGDAFPTIKILIALAQTYRRPEGVQPYNAKQIPESFCTLEESAKQLKALYAMLDDKFGTDYAGGNSLNPPDEEERKRKDIYG
jgi:hypothetical protein